MKRSTSNGEKVFFINNALSIRKKKTNSFFTPNSLWFSSRFRVLIFAQAMNNADSNVLTNNGFLLMSPHHRVVLHVLRSSKKVYEKNIYSRHQINIRWLTFDNKRNEIGGDTLVLFSHGMICYWLFCLSCYNDF
jgi:hypothetical protein